MDAEIWVSDGVSFFAHRALYKPASRHTYCGIALGRFDDTVIQLLSAALDKPKCTACIDGIRVTNG